MGADEEPEVQLFRVHLAADVAGWPATSEDGIKVTAKAKTLGKPFAKVVLGNFFKWYNQRHGLAEADALGEGALEAVAVERGAPIDTAAPVRALLPARPSGPDGAVRVDLFPKKDRRLCFTLAGIELPMSISARFVTAPLSLYVLPEFIRTVSEQYEVPLSYNDCAQVRLLEYDEDDLAAAQVDLAAPACRVVPREGELRIEVVLKPDAAKRTAVRIPQRPEDLEAAEKRDSGVFRIRCGDVELKHTVPPKGLGRSLREAVVEPFVAAYAKKTGTPADLDWVVGVVVDGLPTNDAMLAQSFVLGNVVRVELELEPPPADGAEPVDGAESADSAEPAGEAGEAGEVGEALAPATAALELK
jgi:hypothetical protein